MWYFTWLLGILLASSVAIINVMWLELNVMEMMTMRIYTR